MEFNPFASGIYAISKVNRLSSFNESRFRTAARGFNETAHGTIRVPWLHPDKFGSAPHGHYSLIIDSSRSSTVFSVT